MQKRCVFFISDGTGISAETLGNSLLTQFESIEFERTTMPYIDSIDKANETIAVINACHDNNPIVFSTLINPDIRRLIHAVPGHHFDYLKTFLGPMENALGEKSSYTIGRSHGVYDHAQYQHRIEAVNYSLSHDDGILTRSYSKADVILIGVSRCGKTPTCLYLALQYGIFAANYPFTEDDIGEHRLPDILKSQRHKLFGLTIDSERLGNIRKERRPNSRYAQVDQCRREVQEIESIYQQYNIPFLNTTQYSIEEIATKIIALCELKRRA